MTIWVIAGLLGMATGLRIGWALVNRQSVVSSAMIVALGSLAVLALLNWPPVTLLVDTALGWPNIAIGLSEVALVASAAGSCVMITSVASTRNPSAVRNLAVIQYCVAALIAAVAVGLFIVSGRQPEMTPREYLSRNLGAANTALHWLVPLLYVLLALTLVSWVGMRLANPTRRGRALFVFTIGIALIVASSAFVLIRAVGTTNLVGVGTAATLLAAAMTIVAAGSMLPAIEDWVGSRHELRLIRPLRDEMMRRHPDIGIGVRPRGPLAFRVAEQLSLISDSLYLEANVAQSAQTASITAASSSQIAVTGPQQALAVARWIHGGRGNGAGIFPGRGWLRQPASYSDRDWIIEISRQYRNVDRIGHRPNTDDVAGLSAGPAAG
ncbi:MAG: hypothetical protein WCJ53_03790 [Mycobacteriaceae bacterium]